MSCICVDYKKNRIKEALKLLENAIYNDKCNYMLDIIRFTDGLHVNFIFKTTLLKKNYNMPLINFACKCNSILSIKCLIKNKANINVYDKKGWLPIHYASIYHEQYENEALLTLLYCRNINIHWPTTGGKNIVYNNVKMNTKHKNAYQLANHYLCYGSCDIIQKYINHKANNNKDIIPVAPMARPCIPSAPLK